MERNTLTTVAALQTGDRFYKASDRKREKWTKLALEEKQKKTFFKTYNHRAVKDGQRHAEYLNSTTKVVYLITVQPPLIF